MIDSVFNDRIYTIFGSGFIGRAIAARLDQAKIPWRFVSRGAWPEEGTDLGRVIFTSGMTSGFRENIKKTAEVHVSYLLSALERFKFERFVYLSSTRLYIHTACTAEDTPIIIVPSDVNDIFTATKITAELILTGQRDSRFRIARLSNVFGVGDNSSNFLTSLLNDRREGRPVIIRNSRKSNKDYIHIDEVVTSLLKLSDAQSTLYSTYNIASGENTTNAEIASIFETCGCPVKFENEQQEITFPRIDVKRFRDEFGVFSGRSFRDNLVDILST